MLAAAQDRQVSSRAIETIRGASEIWQTGDKALAQIRLAYIGLPVIDEKGAYRLHLAADLLDKGFSPLLLLKELGLSSSLRALEKYSPDQPRVPAGSGRERGRWTSGNAANASMENPPQRNTIVQRVDIQIVGAIRSDANPDYLTPGALYAQLAKQPIITQEVLDHIRERHRFSSTVPDKGKFSPEYSSDDQIKNLIQDAWKLATPADVALAHFGNIVIAGAVFDRDNDTGVTIPHIIGQSATGRAGAPSIPTNAYVIILTPDLKVLTCYPVNPADRIHPRKDAEE